MNYLIIYDKDEIFYTMDYDTDSCGGQKTGELGAFCGGCSRCIEQQACFSGLNSEIVQDDSIFVMCDCFEAIVKTIAGILSEDCTMFRQHLVVNIHKKSQRLFRLAMTKHGFKCNEGIISFGDPDCQTTILSILNESLS